jgi:hypothetical protein
MQHRRFCHRNASGSRRKILARQVKKYRAAEAGDAGAGVVIDLDDEIVEVVVAPEPVRAGIAGEPDRSIVMAAGGILAPAILGANSASGQEGLRPRMTVGAPPQTQRPENASGRPTVALALVGKNSSAPKRNRDHLVASRQPAPPGIASGSADSDRTEGAIGRSHLVSIWRDGIIPTAAGSLGGGLKYGIAGHPSNCAWKSGIDCVAACEIVTGPYLKTNKSKSRYFAKRASIRATARVAPMPYKDFTHGQRPQDPDRG